MGEAFNSPLYEPNPTTDDAFVLACVLSRWSGDKRTCRWCDAPLSGRQQRWCSPKCANDCAANHWFSYGRSRVRRRDEHTCVECGTPEVREVDGRPVVVALQVHHRDERAHGRHGKCSCVHHLDGLVTLCRPCHLAAHRKPKPAQLAL